MYSLAVIIVYTFITVFISSIYDYSTYHYPWEKDSDFQVSVKEVKFLFVIRFRGIYLQEVKYTTKILWQQICNARNLINHTSVNELSRRIANDFVNKTTSNWQWKVNFHYFF